MIAAEAGAYPPPPAAAGAIRAAEAAENEETEAETWRNIVR